MSIFLNPAGTVVIMHVVGHTKCRRFNHGHEEDRTSKRAKAAGGRKRLKKKKNGQSCLISKQ